MAGLSARHPLVDVDVIDVALRLDPELAFDPRFNRPMLREAITGLVPEAVRLRRGKSNFDALFHTLLAGPEAPAAERLLDPARARLNEYVDMGAIHDDLFGVRPADHPEGIGRWAIRAWRLITAEMWLRSLSDADEPLRLGDQLALQHSSPTFEVHGNG